MKLHKSIIKSSIILLLGFGLFSVLNFVYQMIMARMLSLADYGILATLFAVVYFTAIFSEPIQTTFAKYSTSERDMGKLKYITKKSFYYSSILSSAILIILIISSLFFSKSLNIGFSLLFISCLFIYSSFFNSITRGIMQGKKKFFGLGFNMFFESASKLILAVSLVYVGWSVYGAILAPLAATVLAFLLSFVHTKEIFNSKEKKAEFSIITKDLAPIFIISSVILITFSIDIFIAKIFFSPELAGAYSIASLISKTVFLLSVPVSRAMFPYTAEKSNNSESEKILINSLLILSVIVILSLFVTYFFPNILVIIYAGADIVSSTSVLFLLTIANSILSFANLFLIYNISIGRKRNYPYLLLFIPVEIALLSFFSSNLTEYSYALIVSSAMFLWASIVILKD